MGLLEWLRTGYRSHAAEAIAEFWAWWPSVADEVAKAAGDAEGADLPKKLHRIIAAKVAAIHPELSWEVTDGVLARHALVLTSEGSPHLRGLTERWRRSGPPDNESWEFSPSRPPNPQAMHGVLTVGKRVLKPLQAGFGADVDTARGRVHVLIYHPDMPYLDDAERLWFGFLLLDWILGEDDVERWIGEVRFSDTAQSYDGPGLRRVVSELSRELGAGQWATLEGIDEAGHHVTVQVRIPFPRLRYPLFDAHCAMRIPLLHTPELPDDEITALAIDPPAPDELELAEVEALTNSLMTLLGDSAVLAAVETVATGRTLHIYADSDGVVPAQVGTWLDSQRQAAHQRFSETDSSHPQRDITVAWSHDPGWERVRHFT